MKNTIILAIVAFLFCITNVYAVDSFHFTAILGKGWYPGATIKSVSSDSPKILRCSKVTTTGWNVYQWTCVIDNTKKGDDPILDLHTTPKGNWYPTITLTECTWSGYAQRWLCKAKVSPELGEADVTPANKLAKSFTINFRWVTKK